MLLIYKTLLALVAAYLFLLWAVNCIPHIRVKSIRWMALHGVEISTPNVTINVGRIVLRLNSAWSRWSSESPFKMITIAFQDTVIVERAARKDLERAKFPSKGTTLPSLLEESIAFVLPKWVYSLLVNHSWLNDLTLQFFHFSVFHHAMNEDVSFHVAYLKMECTYQENKAQFGATLLDCFIKDKSKNCSVSSIRLFHNLELFMTCEADFSCPTNNRKRIVANLGNFDLSLIFGQLHIQKLSLILEKKRTKHQPDIPGPKKQLDLREVFQKSNLLSAIQIKFDQGIIEFKEIKIVASSFSIAYNRDQAFKQRSLGKISSNITSAKMYHLDQTCLEIPSLTYILDLDWTDFVRASKSDTPEDFQIHVSTTLSMTNPAFNVFFDQLSYLFDIGNERKPAQTSGPAKIQNQEDLIKKMARRLKRIGMFSVKIVVVDLKGCLHMPSEENADFNRNSMSNIITNTGSQGFLLKSSSKNIGNLLNEEKSGGSSIKSFFKIRNMYVEVAENKIFLSGFNSLISYSLKDHKIALRISCKSLQLKSVNTMIFHVMRRIQDERNKKLNHACANMKRDSATNISSSSTSLDNEIQTVMVDIFELLPSIVHSVKLRANLISTYIICNDSLPSQVIYDEKLGEEVDLGSFKRGVSFSAIDLTVKYLREEDSFEAILKQLQANTLSDYSREYVDDFDKRDTNSTAGADMEDTFSIESGMSGFSSINSEDDVKTVKRVLLVENIQLSNPKKEHKKLVLNIPEIQVRVDSFLIWCVMYAHIMVKMIAPKVEKTYSKEQKKQLKGYDKKINLDVVIGSFTVVARLAHNVDILLEIDSLNLRDVLIQPHCQVGYFRLYVLHPTTKFWARMVSIKETFIDLDSVSRTSITLSTRTIRLNIPFQYLVYTVIDNIITTVKAAKQMKQNFENLSKNINDFSRIEPSAREAIKMPSIRWTAKTFGLTLESDPFETELSFIYEFGVIENQERRRKSAIFEKKAHSIRSKAKDSLTEAPVETKRFLSGSHNKHRSNLINKVFFGNIRDTSPDSAGSGEIFCSSDSKRKSSMKEGKSGPSKCISSIHESKSKASKSAKDEKSAAKDPNISDKSSFKRSTKDSIGGFKNTFLGKSANSNDSHETHAQSEEICEEDQQFLLENAEAIIEEAHDLLMEDFSLSWVNKYKAFKQSKLKSLDQKMHHVWGEDKVNDLIKSQFDVQDYAPGPLQFHSAFKDFDLHVEDPQLPDIHQFLYEYGKGQPRLDYSILIPLRIHLRSSYVYMSPRDYPLPLLLFPENSDPDVPVMDFTGTIVINEKLVSIKEELREIFVPISPAVTEQNSDDNFYSLTVIRTLTPVKTMFDVSIKLQSEQSCIISWCKAYQPALSSISMAFQNFTKPEIDDSPLGWWDKMALNTHGKASFDIASDLCLHIKSAISPYILVGKSSGLVFCWKDNVKLRINETGKHDELFTVTSDDFILAIPDYANIEGKAWNPLNKQHDEDSGTGKFQKRIMKLTSDEGVKWSLGFLFERNVDKNASELGPSMKRTHHFKPHYDVVVTGPQYDYHPDSYEEFRSDYLHLAISVKSTSSKGSSYNYAYLTPLTIDYFKAWWHTLNDNVSLPIREGKLFALSAFKDSSVKFGTHIFTLKYQLIIEPLTISYTVFSTGGEEVNHNVLSYGIKGKVNSCCIDLHQRREFVRYINEKLGIDRKFRKLKLNLGEVEVSDADIRLMYARFSDIAMEGKLLSYYIGDTPKELNLDDYEAEIKEQRFKIRQKQRIPGDFDSSWIDYDDFIELEEDEVLFPDTYVKIAPFFFTPKFTFFREFTLEVPEGKYPFGHEPSHNCLIGVNSPKEIQAQLIQARMAEVKTQVHKDKHKLKSHHSAHTRNALENEISQGNDKILRLQRILDGVTCFSSEDSAFVSNNSSNSYSEDDSSSLHQVTSRATSNYSAIRSIDQANDVVNANSSLSDYHNRYLIHNLKMLWNNDVSEIFSPFLSAIGRIRTERIAMSTRALDLMEKILNNAKEDNPVKLEDPKNIPEANQFTGEDVVEAFEEYLGRLEFENGEIEYGSLVKFIRPQVAFSSKSDPESSIILTSSDIELRVLDENIAGTNDIISKEQQEVSLIETRYGVLFRDSSAFAFHKSNFPHTSTNHYGIAQSKYAWPHWIDVEYSDNDCSDYQKNLVIERTTMALTLKKPNMLSIESSMKQPKKSEFVVHLKKLVVNATSSQYSGIYFILTDLFSPKDKNSLRRRLEQVSSVSDASDFTELADKVKMLQNNMRVYRYLLLKISEKNLNLSPESQRQRSSIRFELYRMKIELMIIIRGLELVGSHNNIGAQERTRNWIVNADQIILHLLEDSREPLADFALANCKFNRSEDSNGSNSNFIDVKMIQGFNLQPNATYPELLRPFLELNDSEKTAGLCDSTQSMINMHWEMLNPVGGIRVMNNAELKIQPINVQLDYDTATKLFNYLFPKSDDSDNMADEEGPSSDDMTDGIDSIESNGSPSSLNTFSKIFRRTKFRNAEHSSVHGSNRDSSEAESTSVASTENSGGFERKAAGKSKRQSSKRVFHDEISQIMDRSSHYFVVGDFKVSEMKLRISFKAPKHLNIIDVHNLVFSIPVIHYKDKTWTTNDFVLQLRKDVIKIFLANSGKIISNKFKIRNRKHAPTPLKQISDYSHYMTLDDLQEEGRARDEIRDYEIDAEASPMDANDVKIASHLNTRPKTSEYRKNADYEQILESAADEDDS